jgi:5-methylcytosine-specific restriction protein B
MPNTPELIELYDEFLRIWPLNRLQNLTIEEYTNLEKDSFCYWIESKLDTLGSIWGGSAFKFGIYKRFNKDKIVSKKGFLTDGNYSWLERYGKDLNSAFQSIKSNIISIAENANNGTFENIDTIDIGDTYKWKIAFHYSNFQLIPIFKKLALEYLADDLGMEDAFSSEYSNLYRFLLNEKPAGMDMLSYSGELWKKYEEFGAGNYYIIGSKYGEKNNEDIFPQFLERSVISTGFAWDLDLTPYLRMGHPEFKKVLAEMGYDDKAWNALKFFKELQPGDKIAIKSDGSPKGTRPFLFIVALAEVVEVNGKVYEHDPDGLGHIVHVEFTHPEVNKDFALGGYGRTLQKLTNVDHIKLIFKSVYETKFDKPTEMNNSEKPYINTILYGPPGTGKTYHTINYALAIIDGIDPKREYSKEERKAHVNRFEELRQKGIVEFITFHQNYSYEEFVQGLRPVIGKEGEALSFKKEDGIFKKLADRAYKNLVGEAVEEKQKLTFAELLAKFLEPVKRREEIEISSIASKFYITGEEEKYITFRNINGNPFKLNKIYLEMAYQRGSLDGIIEGGLATYYEPVLMQLKKLRDQVETEFKPIEQHDFVLIIDEINRANISRVFGELITLIEEDKRWDNEHKLKIKLPLGDEFAVPKNLYIIGTMNTADKSIALLDIALRRRFEFVPMYPNANKVEPEVQLFFEKLNEAIKKERGADFAIGHSYLMNNQPEKEFDFSAKMNRKIIPLLNEYFYSAKEGKVKEIIETALSGSGLNNDYELQYSPLGILTMKGK